MKIKKNFYRLFVSLMLLSLLVACSSQSASNEGSGSDSNENSGQFAQGVTDDEILVGLIGPQTGPAAAYDILRKSVDTYFNYVNENGGVNNRKIKLIAYDDQYQPAKAVQLAKRLVEDDKVFATVGLTGTANNLATKDYFIEKGVPVIFPVTPNKELVEPVIKNYMGLGAVSLALEARVYLDYAVNELGAKTIGLAYQNDDLGKEGYNTIMNNIGNYAGVEIVTEVGYLASDTEFSSHAQKLKKADPDVIFNFGSINPGANLKKELHKIGLDKPYIVSSGIGNDTKVFELAGKDIWEGSYSISAFTYTDEEFQLVVDRFKKDYPNETVSNFALTGWAYAQVFVEALKRTGDDLTWDNFLNSFYSLDKWDGSVFTGITFTENNHYGITSFYITQARDGKIEPYSKTITFDPATDKITYSE